MKPERWEHVKSLFELALERQPDERASWVDEHCAGDDELGREVKSLLAAHDDDFLEGPLVFPEGFEERLPPADAVNPGTRIGAYEIVSELGRGGMGAVYLAARADREFEKRVAIKLIRRDRLTELAVRRFRNERQILAALEHPHIARLIDGGTTPEGLPYFVMEYVEGKPLLQYCEEHSAPVRQRLELFLKICGAVHYAHRRMIIHRDLKPGNVLVNQAGAPRLLDFGIAKLLDPETGERGEESTVTGVRAMTPAYASPEQLRGKPATVRSDVYSLGVILLELVTGRRTLAIEETGGAPAADAKAAEGVTDLTRIARRAMRYAPEERYESVAALSADIESYVAGTGVPQYEFRTVKEPVPVPQAASTVSVAVLPLRRLSADVTSDAYLGIGLADAVITKLSNVARITVRPTSTAMRYAETDDPVSAGKEMAVDFVLEGRIQKSANHVRVTVQLVRVQSGIPVWAAHFDQEFEDLLKLEDSISAQVALALIPQLTKEEQERIARQGTAKPKAHEAYLRGRWHSSAHTGEGWAKALVAFMEAIAEDPQYALAHAGVADYYLQLAVWGDLPPAESFAAAKDAASKALEIDPALAEAHASLAFAVWALDRDYRGADHHFQMAIALNPDYPQAHHWFGLFQLTRGRPSVALASLENARKFAPHTQILTVSYAFCLYHVRQYDRAIEELGNAIRLHGDDSRVQEVLAWCCLAKNQISECLLAARRAVEISRRNPFSLCVLANAEAAAGNRSAAVALVDEMTARAQERRVSGYVLGCANLGLGRKKEALKLVEQAWHDHDWWTYFVSVSPAWDALRDTPRFLRLVEAISAPGGTAWTSPRGMSSVVPKTQSRMTTAIVAVALAVLVVYGVIAWFHPKARPFETTRMAKITTNGTAVRAVVSPDGQQVAFVSNEHGKPILWLRKIDSPETRRIAGPVEGDINSINFTNNGKDICFVASNRSDPDRGTLYLVSLSGGAPRELMTEVSKPVAPSLDGARLVFLQRNAEGHSDDLYVAQLDGRNQRKIASRHYPDRFAWDSLPAWSPDGKMLAIGVEGADKQGFYVDLMIVRVQDGSTQIIRAPRWQYLERIAWLDRARGLVVIGQEAESSFQHIWYIPYPKGDAKRINNDLSDYVGVSLTSTGKTLVSVQYQTLSNLYVSRRDNASQAVQVTPGLGRYFDISWSIDGKIAYASDASGSADIWMMNSNGAGQQQLTAHNARNYAPAVSPDGNWIVFHSNRSGNWNIWRMGANGAGPTPLTADKHDSNWPRFTPDGRYVVYHHTGGAGWNLWQVPLAGGTPIQLTTAPSIHPAVSPKDGRIACWYSEDFAKPSWKLAVLPASGGAPSRYYELPPTAVADSAIQWTPAGDGITFLDARNGAYNLWVQPVEGGSPRQLTTFSSGQIYSFDWARDGRLIYSRGISSSDVVLIQDVGRN